MGCEHSLLDCIGATGAVAPTPLVLLDRHGSGVDNTNNQTAVDRVRKFSPPKAEAEIISRLTSWTHFYYFKNSAETSDKQDCSSLSLHASSCLRCFRSCQIVVPNVKLQCVILEHSVIRKQSQATKKLCLYNYLTSAMACTCVHLKTLKVAQVEYGHPVWFVSFIKYASQLNQRKFQALSFDAALSRPEMKRAPQIRHLLAPSSITALKIHCMKSDHCRILRFKTAKKKKKMTRLLLLCSLLQVCGCRQYKQRITEFWSENSAGYSLRQGIHRPLNHAEKTPPTRT